MVSCRATKCFIDQWKNGMVGKGAYQMPNFCTWILCLCNYQLTSWVVKEAGKKIDSAAFPNFDR